MAELAAVINDSGDSLRENMQRVFNAQQAKALELRRSTVEERIQKIEKILAAVETYRQDIYQAAAADMRKPETEVELTEIYSVLTEGRHTIKHLRSWMKPQKVKTPMAMLGTSGEIRYEPKGVCLIVSPWNYPLNLTFGPLISCIAAGNTAMLKPSEMTPHLSALMARIVGELFEENEVAIFEGAVEVSTALLELPYDHIFFTGAPAIGKVVMAAAAKHLTSVTLELGGKSPVIVDQSANLKDAARNILWGKTTNCGQTCIAPDYLYVHESIKDEFLAECRAYLSKAFGKVDSERRTSPDFGRIVNQRHFKRISNLLDDATERGAKVEIGGDRDADSCYIAPTLLSNVPDDSAIMEEEIFGPLFPIHTYSDVDTVIDYINSKPKPLALYIFSKDKARTEHILQNTTSGGSAINHTIIHILNGNLPFGGVNNSGLGSSHGIFGFKAFSHERAVLTNTASSMHLFYPPYTGIVKKLVNIVVKYF